MKISKKITSLLSIGILSLPWTQSFANEATSIDKIASPVSVEQLTEKLQSAGVESIYNRTRTVISDSYIDNYNVEDNNTVMVHNNGNPLPTDMFEKKQGNELFAVLITDEDGVQTPTYYFSNSKVLMDDTLEEIVEDLSSQSNENKGARVVGSNYVSRNYKWDFYRKLATGSTIQQGSLATRVTFERIHSNANVDYKKSSVWDITARSEVKCRSSERINNTFVRLDAGSGSQKLLDFAPETSSQSLFTASLDSLFSPTSWTIEAGGYTTKELVSSLSNRYGRWEFKARPGFQTSWVTKPGVRVANSTGSLYLKYSQTLDLNYSDHRTGVVGITVPDR